MAVENISPGKPKPFFGESASDLIEEFVRTDYAKVVETVALSTGERDKAEDAVQVALLRILAEGWRPLHVGLHVAVVAADLIRSRLDWRDRMAGWGGRMIGRTEDDTEPASGGALRTVLSELPRGQRTVSLLHYYLGYPTSDIAVVLGVPRALVTVRLRWAKSRLEGLLVETGE